MRGQSLISIIVPVYNTEPYLRKCVDSILNQTYTNLEIILVNDGSTDGSGAICDEYAAADSRIIVIHKENGGVGSARNEGLKIIKGQYIGFVDSDDMISTDMYHILYDLCKETDSDISQVQITPITLKNIRNGKRYRTKIYEGGDTLKTFLYSGLRNSTQTYSVCNKLYKKELFNDIFFPDNKAGEDLIVNYLVLKQCKRYVRTDKACYEVNKDNISATRDVFTATDYDIYNVYDKVLKFAQSTDDDEVEYLASISRVVCETHLLYKMVMHGFDETIENPRKEASSLIANLRSNYKKLIASPLPLRQKIVITGYCISFKLMKAVAAIYKLTLGGRLAR